jgi:hypothetical protein
MSDQLRAPAAVPKGKKTQYTLNRRARASLHAVAKRKIPFSTLAKIEHQSSFIIIIIIIITIIVTFMH